MAYSVQKSRRRRLRVFRLFCCSLPVVPIRAKRRVSGDESYLDAAPLAELHAPAGMILPITTGDYVIPVTKGAARLVRRWISVRQRSR